MGLDESSIDARLSMVQKNIFVSSTVLLTCMGQRNNAVALCLGMGKKPFFSKSFLKQAEKNVFFSVFFVFFPILDVFFYEKCI